MEYGDCPEEVNIQAIIFAGDFDEFPVVSGLFYYFFLGRCKLFSLWSACMTPRVLEIRNNKKQSSPVSLRSLLSMALESLPTSLDVSILVMLADPSPGRLNAYHP